MTRSSPLQRHGPTILLAATLLASTLAAQQHDRLLVCNKGAASLSIFDLATRRELAVVPTGTGPHEVAVSADGRTAVVSDYGDRTPGHTLTVIDVLRGERLRTIELVRLDDDDATEAKQVLRPHGIRFTGEHTVVVTSESSRRLVQFDLTDGRALRSWTTPQSTMHMVALANDGSRAFATSIRDGDLALFDLRGDAAQPLAVVACGEGSEGLAVDPVCGEVWVGNRAANSISVVDPTQRKVVATLATADFPFRIAFAPGGGPALVSCTEGGEVQVFDAATRELTRSIPISGDGSELSPLPMGICTDREGRFAYVACGRGEFVAVLDLTAGKLVDRMPTRAGPDGIAVAHIVGDEAAPPAADPVIR